MRRATDFVADSTLRDGRTGLDRASAVAMLIGALGAASACGRTPPEPSPAASPTTSALFPDSSKRTYAERASAPYSTDGRFDDGGRCLLATPVAAPPALLPVAAALCPRDPDGVSHLKEIQVSFPEGAGAGDRGHDVRIDVELVASEAEVQRGLMYRTSMPADRGMLFRLGERRVHSFWMHNTCIPLDLVFVEDDGFVVGIVEGATPLTDTTRSVGCPSSWVLETNAGWTRQHGVRAGQKMVIPAAAR